MNYDSTIDKRQINSYLWKFQFVFGLFRYCYFLSVLSRELQNNVMDPKFLCLVADTQLSERLCPSVGRLALPLVRPSVRQSMMIESKSGKRA